MRNSKYLVLLLLVLIVSLTFGATITLQQGVDGYTGCSDMFVVSAGGGVHDRPADGVPCGTHPRLALGIRGT